MSYNIDKLPRYANTAGKITVITALLGVVVFAVVFLLNIGVKELNEVAAQSSGLATTTVTVLNTPPAFVGEAEEVVASTSTSPTNSGDVISWHATATDSNNEDFYLLICTGTSTPTVPSANTGAAPSCANGQTMWAVSAAASSGDSVTAATTTLDRNIAPGPGNFAEENVWYAWVCDSVAVNPRCNATYSQGTGDTGSPFNVNSRPLYTGISSDSPALPGATITFTATADDDDNTPTDDTIRLWVCNTQSFNSTSSIGCNGTTMASSTLSLSNPTAAYTVPTPMPDGPYQAYTYIVDLHGHTAIGSYQSTSSPITILNATPTIAAGQITLEDGNAMTLAVNSGETTGFTLQYVVQDNNSCDANEIADYRVSIYRSGIGSSTCDGITGTYNANNCYTTSVPTTTWDISCTASSTSCTYGVDGTDDEEIWDCTFPLWFVADPTDGTTASTSPYFAEDWRAAVYAIDDNGATSTRTENSTAADVNDLIGFLYFSLDTGYIPYGSLEPGSYTPTLTATTTIRSEGNIGLDEKLEGTPMCEESVFNTGSTCPNSSTSTIQDYNQAFATSSIAYGTASTSGQVLSSSTPYRLDINVLKPTSTATTTTGVTYWGINIPSAITLAGDYEGENTFYGVASHGSQWY